jgi:hypothetical protein
LYDHYVDGPQFDGTSRDTIIHDKVDKSGEYQIKMVTRSNLCPNEMINREIDHAKVYNIVANNVDIALYGLIGN